MKKSVIFSLFILLIVSAYSCRTSQKTENIQTIDLQSKKTIDDGSILLNRKSKIAILNNTHYANKLIDSKAFHPKRDGNINFSDLGSSSTHLTIDTTLCSNILANTTTIELSQKLIGDIFIVELSKGNYTDENRNILISLIKEQYQPNILIILTKQKIRIKGDAYNIGFRTKEVIGSDQYMTGMQNRQSVDICIDYENEWIILDMKASSPERRIIQTKTIKSSYTNWNDLTIYLLECARISSQDFAALFAIK